MNNTDLVNILGQLGTSAIKMLRAPATFNGPVNTGVFGLMHESAQKQIADAIEDLAEHGLLTEDKAAHEIMLTQDGRAAATLVKNSPLQVIHAQFAAADADDASSNDVVQLLDDLLVAYGLNTVLYGR